MAHESVVNRWQRTLQERRQARYFAKSMAEDLRPIVFWLAENRYLVTDGFCGIIVGASHPVFDSRRLVPVLPTADLNTSGQAGTLRKGLLPDFLADSYQTKPLTLTPWLLERHGQRIRVGKIGKELVYLNCKLTNMLALTFDSLQEHQWAGTTRKKVILARRGGEIVFVVMPMGINSNENDSDFLTSVEEV
jgi:hypothetical protein